MAKKRSLIGGALIALLIVFTVLMAPYANYPTVSTQSNSFIIDGHEQQVLPKSL